MRSSRGGFDIEKILKFLEEKEINQLYIIGGGKYFEKSCIWLFSRTVSHTYLCYFYQTNRCFLDGTHRGAYAIHQACMKNMMNVAVAGIPKTIDNGKRHRSRIEAVGEIICPD